jgi:hypothetical protein
MFVNHPEGWGDWRQKTRPSVVEKNDSPVAAHFEKIGVLHDRA